jgi:hypothetical protein
VNGDLRQTGLGGTGQRGTFLKIRLGSSEVALALEEVEQSRQAATGFGGIAHRTVQRDTLDQAFLGLRPVNVAVKPTN